MRRGAATGWVWAVTGSFVVHAALLLLVAQRSRDRFLPVPGAAVSLADSAPPDEPTWIDVVAAEDRAAATVPAVLPDPPVDLRSAPEGDRDRVAPLAIGPRVAAGRDSATPATDRGVEGGRLPERAWRRDQSTLHERVTDGSAVTQPSRQRMAARASSPEAVRREPVTGIADSVNTRVPSRVPAATQYASPEDEVSEDGTGADQPSRSGAAADPALDVPRVAQEAVRDRGEGPLDADNGARSFDTPRRGPAADVSSTRSASNEKHPSLTDFSHAGVSAAVDSLQGRGPGEAPGATTRLTTGSALNEYGAARVQQPGPVVNESSQDRRYQRYVQEIIRRVNSTREFPKSLALRLEQGETIVYFVLRTDGKISDGVRVVKSSGFDEFDSAATRAVLRAAPFPPMPDPASARPLPISVRVAFENPVVR